MQTKKCKDCEIEKKITEFYKCKTMSSGYFNDCKECAKIRIKKSSRNIKKKCLMCKKEFGTCLAEIKRGGGKFCSRECWYKFNEDKNVCNYKGKKGCNNGYDYIHKWIKEKLGKPNYCEKCKTTKAKRFEWSNISGKYKKDISDWQRLCSKCHGEYDSIRRKTIIVNCVVCGRKIETRSKKRKFCSCKCSNKYYRQIK